MHRQFWVRIPCPYCGLECQARRTTPGKPRYIKAHFNDDDELCPPPLVPAGEAAG